MATSPLGSVTPKTPSGLVPFSANPLTLPVSSCERLMWQDSWGQLKCLEGQGKVAEVSAKPASQLSSITTNRCWQLDSLEMQSDHLGSLILLLETPEMRRLCTPDSCGQVNEGYSPHPWGKHPQAQIPYGKSPWRLEQWFPPGRSYSPPDRW